MIEKKAKKPIYKQVWFWLLVIILLAIIGSAIGSSSNSNGGAIVVTSRSAKNSSKSATKNKLYQIGDSVKVDKVTYTLVAIEKTDERNQYEDKQPANVIKVTYHVKNGKDTDLPVGTDLNVYDADNNKLKTYANTNTLDAVAPGKEMDIVTHFGTEKLGEFELQFKPLASMTKAARFTATVN